MLPVNPMRQTRMSSTSRKAVSAVVALLLCVSLSGCLVIGYTSGGGWSVWPGSLVITLVLVLIYFLTRR